MGGRNGANTDRFNGAATCSLRNAAIVDTVECPRCKLQWGRNLFVAECYGKIDNVCQRVSFNGAATCSLRNVRGAAPPRPPVRGASMGPQLVRCGMMSSPEAHAYIGGASMGPQLVRCGMRPRPRRSRSRSLLQWGRNLFVAECNVTTISPHSDVMLQWGRNLFVAEC